MQFNTYFPKVTDELLTNPGIGFIAAPALMQETETIKDNCGEEVKKYKFAANSRTYNHPDSGLWYCGGRWKDIEIENGVYDWHIIDAKLDGAKALGCNAIVRIAPYALDEKDDIPTWLRKIYPDEPEFPFWRIDPTNTEYPAYWARFVSEFAKRYDGHPLISSVDMAIAGAWGEGGGTEMMDDDSIDLIVSAYISGFKITPLQALLHDEKSLGIIRRHRADIGFRVDCLGDMGGFHGDEWSHMLDFYPENICNFSMNNAWKKAPVVFEACWHMNDWYKQGWDIDYIIDESLKWHISSYNSKASTVPEEWKPAVTRWIKNMGYRYEVHKIQYQCEAVSGESAQIELLVCNVGVAPCYHRYAPFIRLSNANAEYFMALNADNRDWLPGEEHLVKDNFMLPKNIIDGQYSLALGFPVKELEPLHLAIEGRDEYGYYTFGKINIKGAAL